MKAGDVTDYNKLSEVAHQAESVTETDRQSEKVRYE